MVGCRSNHLQPSLARVRHYPSRKEPGTARLSISLGIATMRTDPVNAVADSCGAFDVRFLEATLFLRRRPQELVDAQRPGRLHLLNSIDPQDVGIVVCNRKVVLPQRGRGGTIAGFTICKYLITRLRR